MPASFPPQPPPAENANVNANVNLFGISRVSEISLARRKSHIVEMLSGGGSRPWIGTFPLAACYPHLLQLVEKATLTSFFPGGGDEGGAQRRTQKHALR